MARVMRQRAASAAAYMNPERSRSREGMSESAGWYSASAETRARRRTAARAVLASTGAPRAAQISR
jgi:hypothetical protein